jgi:NADH-quinone oxidoreductase subunit D
VRHEPPLPRDLEALQTDLTTWIIGPYHGALPGPMKLKLRLDGEMVVKAEVENGFLHRGLEKAFELHPWSAGVMYADHLDPESAVFGELAFCLAVEEAAGLGVPERAQAIRLVLCELTRISAHMGFLARMARAVGADTVIHYVLRDREKILDLFELLTGARFSLNFLRYGGVAADVTEGFIERVLETCDQLRIRLKEYNDILTFNQAFLKRTAFLGTLGADRARRHGVTGPNARAGGVAFDARKAHPASGYQRIDFEVVLGQGAIGALGDAHDRFLIRLREIDQSLAILRQLADRMPAGEFATVRVTREFTVPPGEAYARVESARGLLGCYLASDGGARPARVQFRAPSANVLLAVPELLEQVRIEDVPVVLASLDIGMAEVDR